MRDAPRARHLDIKLWNDSPIIGAGAATAGDSCGNGDKEDPVGKCSSKHDSVYSIESPAGTISKTFGVSSVTEPIQAIKYRHMAVYGNR